MLVRSLFSPSQLSDKTQHTLLIWSSTPKHSHTAGLKAEGRSLWYSHRASQCLLLLLLFNDSWKTAFWSITATYWIKVWSEQLFRHNALNLSSHIFTVSLWAPDHDVHTVTVWDKYMYRYTHTVQHGLVWQFDVNFVSLVHCWTDLQTGRDWMHNTSEQGNVWGLTFQIWTGKLTVVIGPSQTG